jgi:drug/metabolite transporter (DMT)-like permease
MKGVMDTTLTLPTNRLTRGYLICLVGTVAWSTTGVLMGYLVQTFQLPSLVLAFWRDLSFSLALGLGLALLQPGLLKVDRRHMGFLAVYGLVFAVFNSLWTFSVTLNGAAVATVLAYSSPAFTAVIAWRLLGEKLSVLKAVVIAVSILGCVFVSGAYNPATWQLNYWGILVGLFSGILFAIYNLMGKYALQRNLNTWSSLLYGFSFATLFLLFFNLIPDVWSGANPVTNLFWLGGSFTGWAVLVFLGIGPTIAGYGFYTLSLSYLPASVANLIATLEPGLTAGMAYLFLGEIMSGAQIFGSLLIIISVVVLRLRERD